MTHTFRIIVSHSRAIKHNRLTQANCSKTNGEKFAPSVANYGLGRLALA